MGSRGVQDGGDLELLPAEKATQVAVEHTVPGALGRDRPPGRTLARACPGRGDAQHRRLDRNI
jgi:hypothetical protein